MEKYDRNKTITILIGWVLRHVTRPGSAYEYASFFPSDDEKSYQSTPIE